MPKTWSVPKRVWRVELDEQGLGGVAADDDFVVVSSRDKSDTYDVFLILDVASGEQLGRIKYEAKASLDYGNSPRATPVINESHVYCLGAMGQLTCFHLETGEVAWTKHLVDDLGGKMPNWGYAGCPVLYKDRLIVQPGGLESGWVALHPLSGKVLWKAPGRVAGYSSPIIASIHGVEQLINYDANSLGGWSVDDGRRLWELKPPNPRDFNVPTPVVVDGKLFLVTENNGARLYAFDHDRPLEAGPQLIAESDMLNGDSHSPVRIGNRIVGVDRDLVLLDPALDLAEISRLEDSSLWHFTSIIADEDRVLVHSSNGTILLAKVNEKALEFLGKVSIANEPGDLYAHPALHNGTLYIRGPRWLDSYQW